MPLYSYLGACCKFNLKWDYHHIDRSTSTATQRLAQLRRILKYASTQKRKMVYQSLIRLLHERACQMGVWPSLKKSQISQFMMIQNKRMRYIFNIKMQIGFTHL